MDRRSALRRMVAGSAACAATAITAPVAAAATPVAPRDALGMLYDTTRCIGCKACVTACYQANNLQPDRGTLDGGVHQAPARLNEFTKNIIKLYKDDDSPQQSYMKQQCMHCIDPACVAACMMHALTKNPTTGVVSWTGDACVGCRYCQIACPFNVPKFEWTALNPRIVKCELCQHRDQGPACCEVCPREAVIYGRREDLLAEAKRRLAASPATYVNKIYGEEDAGGTQVLYLSHVSFDKLGLPNVGKESLPEYTHGVQGALYRGFVAPLALFGGLGLAISRRYRIASEGHAGGHDGAGPVAAAAPGAGRDEVQR